MQSAFAAVGIAGTVLLGDPIATVALTSAAVKVLRQVLNFRNRPEREETKFDPRSLPPELLDKIQLLLSSEKVSTPSVVELSRQAVREVPNNDLIRTKAPEPEVVGLALAVDSDSVFRDARKRTGLVFQLNLGFAIILGIILLAGIAGSMYSALVLQKAAWATVFGGVSVADLLGLYAFKPLTAMNSALVSATRLDHMQLRLKTQLEQCEKYTDIEEKLRCQTAIWEAVEKDLSSLK